MQRISKYRPVIVVIGVSFLLSFASGGDLKSLMGFFLSLLAMLKLIDMKSFKIGFRNYDLVAKKFPIYGLIYPFLELAVGLSFISNHLVLLSSTISLLIGNEN